MLANIAFHAFSIGIFNLDLWKPTGSNDYVLHYTQRITAGHVGVNIVPVTSTVLVKPGLILGSHAINDILYQGISYVENAQYPVKRFERPSDSVWKQGVLHISHLTPVAGVQRFLSLGVQILPATCIQGKYNKRS